MPEKTAGISLPVVLLVFALAAAGNVRLHFNLIDRHNHNERVRLHEQVIADAAPAPSQYRILYTYLAEGLIRAGVPFDTAYPVLRGVFTFLAAALLYIFLLRWLTGAGAFIGALFFFAVLPFTYHNYYMQPHDTLNLVFFIGGLMLIRDRKDAWLSPLLLVAMLNRETAVMLVPVYLFYRYDELPLPAVLARTAAQALVCAGVYIGLRKVFGEHAYYSGFYFLPDNFRRIDAYIALALVFGPFIFAAWSAPARRPKFLVRASAMVPLFFIVHWTVTKAWEPRLWLPLLPIVIPLGLITLFRESPSIVRAPDAPRLDPSPAPPALENSATKNPAAAYALVLLVFLAVFAVFIRSNEDSHLKERDARVLVNRASAVQAEGRSAEAKELLLDALALAPDVAIAHMSLGVVYLEEGNMEFARFHLSKALELDPEGEYAERIKKQLAAMAMQDKRKK